MLTCFGFQACSSNSFYSVFTHLESVGTGERDQTISFLERKFKLLGSFDSPKGTHTATVVGLNLDGEWEQEAVR